MSRIKGKRLQRNHYQILDNNKIKDVENWLYLSMETTEVDGSKNLGRDSEKITYYIFQNRNTGDTIKLK